MAECDKEMMRGNEVHFRVVSGISYSLSAYLLGKVARSEEETCQN